MEKFEFRSYNQLQFITSMNSNFIIIKLNNLSGNLEDIKKTVYSELKKKYLDQPGVYFLRLEDGYYIGETRELSTRLKTHIKNKDIRSITVATYKADIDRLEKEQIRDLESLLITYAEDYGLMLGGELKNKKKENRKVENILNSRENTIYAKYIWDKISYLNLKDILEDKQTIEHMQEVVDESEEEAIIEGNNDHQPKIRVKHDWRNTVNMKIQTVDHEHPIFKYIPYRKIVTKAYDKTNLEIFNKEFAFKALFRYLYENRGNGGIDIELTKGKRDRGWITAGTLAYLRIETNGEARGNLMDAPLNRTEVEKLIKDFIEKNY
ncbi:MAG: hypothetical protein HRT98_02450 [Mycoplasmatales bacterium]|nr:hypothetical protein [Mycoplasmatales bacterium]